MMPVIAYEILFAMRVLERALRVFREFCVEGITADATSAGPTPRGRCPWPRC